jgi:GNAT superfamily N-acetyltransferase
MRASTSASEVVAARPRDVSDVPAGYGAGMGTVDDTGTVITVAQDAGGAAGVMPALRLATASDADDVARLLHDFNVEFDTPTPDVGVLAGRLRGLLAGDGTFAILAGTPAVALALVTLRPNVWCPGPVALLDELYVVPRLRGRGIGSRVIGRLLTEARVRSVSLVEINVDEGDVDARRFYERHGFAATDPGSSERALYYFREVER